METAGRDGVGRGRMAGSAVSTAKGNHLGVNVKQTAVHIEQPLLPEDQCVTGFDLCRGRSTCEGHGRGGLAGLSVLASAWDDVSVDIEQAAISVEQRFLLDYQLVSFVDLTQQDV